MALPQQKLREIVFQLLFSLDFTELEEDEVISLMMKQLRVTRKVMMESQEKRRSVISKVGEIDSLIERFCDAYDLNRISKVEKSILRLAIYEICYEDTIPPKVAISEAIRLTRKFGTAESAGFVNAVCDAVHQQLNNPLPNEKKDESLAPLSIG